MTKTYKKLSVVKVTQKFAEAVKVVDKPLVPPKDDEVLLKNIYAGVNATDPNITAARYFTDGKVPFDIGLESLGTVEAIGKNVTKFKVGQNGLVIHGGANGQLGGYSEYSYLKEDSVIPVPDLKPEYLALLIPGLTATIALDELGRIKKGDKVLITAAAGATGHIAVQWAKQRGCYVIGMTSAPEKIKLLKELGTDRVINYRTENIDEVLTKEFPSGIDVIWETIGGQTFETLFKHLAHRGRFVVIGGISGYQQEGDGFPEVHIPKLHSKLLLNSQTVAGFLLTSYGELIPKYLPLLIGDVISGKLKITVDYGKSTEKGVFFGIDSVVRGVEHLSSGKSIGKVVIKF